ncbi:MAG: DoxX family protein [Bryobacteraceae bacterium]|nr:DoxX family protein [Bryobacteraceae bacterium]
MESKAMIWAGRVMSAIPVLMLLFSAAMKFTGSPQLAEGFGHLGWPVGQALGLGVLELTVTLLYVLPWTRVLGAILVTGYLGGAVAAHVRIGDPFWVQVLLGMLAWGGLYLRDKRLRELLPMTR